MPPTSAAALPHDVLARICSFLPPGDAIHTAPRLNKALAAAAAQRVAELQAKVAAFAAVDASKEALWQFGTTLFSPPLWALREALQCARALGCRWDEWACCRAAANGDLAMLQWARTQEPPCPWDEGTCSFAAYSGHLAVLQWARAQQPPCPWDPEVCFQCAAEHPAVEEWIRAQAALEGL
ncbi:hypothetical protein Rsub_07744 [Raphidocelis subcapitata]|uniref:F-box domain-containing protein n=1 Tax=Raphidocelis subcapitata TaxID=307507 RepID=A0A2V0PBA1_9CHLO|nr:hypothetical protein Rsub_07744 [Raphidocelis subcapitata]|eukprot:GBF95160.1 hypothetical protein Rsub_07744 [Raphidocelis subcapitata]